MRKCLMVGMALISTSSLADVTASLSASMLGATGESIRDGGELQAALGYDSWYLWGSQGVQGQVMSSQSAGDLTVTGLGIGYRHEITEKLSLVAEAGYGKVESDYDNRIFREGAYYSFVPTFGHPSHITGKDGYMAPYMVFQSEFDESPIFKVGVEYNVTDHLSLDLKYRHHRPEQFLRFYNKEMGFSGDNPALCNCAWEGNFMVDMSAVQFGISLKY